MGNNQVICKQCGCLNLEAEDHNKELSEGHEPKAIGLPTLETIETIEPSMLVRMIDHPDQKTVSASSEDASNKHECSEDASSKHEEHIASEDAVGNGCLVKSEVTSEQPSSPRLLLSPASAINKPISTKSAGVRSYTTLSDSTQSRSAHRSRSTLSDTTHSRGAPSLCTQALGSGECLEWWMLG